MSHKDAAAMLEQNLQTSPNLENIAESSYFAGGQSSLPGYMDPDKFWSGGVVPYEISHTFRKCLFSCRNLFTATATHAFEKRASQT